MSVTTVNIVEPEQEEDVCGADCSATVLTEEAGCAGR